jgi:hypothetical protein
VPCGKGSRGWVPGWARQAGGRVAADGAAWNVVAVACGRRRTAARDMATASRRASCTDSDREVLGRLFRLWPPVPRHHRWHGTRTRQRPARLVLCGRGGRSQIRREGQGQHNTSTPHWSLVPATLWMGSRFYLSQSHGHEGCVWSPSRFSPGRIWDAGWARTDPTHVMEGGLVACIYKTRMSRAHDWLAAQLSNC